MKFATLLCVLFLTACRVQAIATTPEAPPAGEWRGIHYWLDSEDAAKELIRTLPALSKVGANALVLEVNYSFEFQTHPELRNRRFIRQETAHELARAAKTNGIFLIPEFNCLGHQSFGQRMSPLLKLHPEFNETPHLSTTNKGVYCLSWCPKADGLHELVFSLIDEIATGFEATAFHVGMDEVYLIANDDCPRCHGTNAANLFADEVQALHKHVVEDKKMRLLMWADRVIGTRYQGTSQYDTAQNDVSTSINHIPKDIILCDWHYEYRKEYLSVPYLAGFGFSVWPTGFKHMKASEALSDYCLAQRTNVIGYLASTWTTVPISSSPEWPPIKTILPQWTGTNAVRK